MLAARAAVVGGAGLTTVALPAELAEALAGGCPEAMTLPLPATASGTLALAGWESLAAAAEARSVVAIGPGLGRHAETDALVRRLALATARPLVLDADGLNAFEGHLDELARRTAPTILTPHPGELARLLGGSSAAIQEDRLGRLARQRGGAARSSCSRGGRRWSRRPTARSGSTPPATPAWPPGGSGDVLTGLVAAALRPGRRAAFAAALSVHLHGSAGDLALARNGGDAVPATELLACYGAALDGLDGLGR